MELKTNLHFHTQDDPLDRINYSFFDGIDEASRLGFSVIALTCHNKLINKSDYIDYAAKKGILLIPGIEKDIERRHVVVLNPEKSVEKVQNFKDLRAYKKNHPEILVLAPHPYFYGNISLKEKLEPNIDLFDAIEFSWFYSKLFNRNVRGGKIAEKYKLPFIATSDTHNLKNLNLSYSLIEAKNKTIPSVFESIKSGHFKNINSPRDFFKEMVLDVGFNHIKNLFAAKKLPVNN